MLALGVGAFLLFRGGKKSPEAIAAKAEGKVQKIITKKDTNRIRKLNRIAFGFAPFKSRRKKEAAAAELKRVELNLR